MMPGFQRTQRLHEMIWVAKTSDDDCAPIFPEPRFVMRESGTSFPLSSTELFFAGSVLEILTIIFFALQHSVTESNVNIIMSCVEGEGTNKRMGVPSGQP